MAKTNTIEIEKIEILELINNKSTRVTFEQNSGGTSEVWQKFTIVKVDDLLSNCVRCNLCKGLLKWKSRDGTSGLSYHLSTCKPAGPGNMKITDSPGFTVTTKTKAKASIPLSVKSETANVIVKMCATDIR
jgi:hypothetical protein